MWGLALSFVKPNWKPIAFGVAAFFLLYGLYLKGYHNGYQACSQSVQKAADKDVEKRQEDAKKEESKTEYQKITIIKKIHDTPQSSDKDKYTGCILSTDPYKSNCDKLK